MFFCKLHIFASHKTLKHQTHLCLFLLPINNMPNPVHYIFVSILIALFPSSPYWFDPLKGHCNGPLYLPSTISTSHYLIAQLSHFLYETQFCSCHIPIQNTWPIFYCAPQKTQLHNCRFAFEELYNRTAFLAHHGFHCFPFHYAQARCCCSQVAQQERIHLPLQEMKVLIPGSGRSPGEENISPL